MPEIPKVVTEATSVLTAWKRSMPHLYCDRRRENEQIQKLYHVEVVKQIVAAIEADTELQGKPATWEVMQDAAAGLREDGLEALKWCSVQASEAVRTLRRGLKDEPAFGCNVELRKNFTIVKQRGALPQAAVVAVKRELTPVAAAPVRAERKRKREAEPLAPQKRDEWFSTVRGQLMHMRKNDEGWQSACHRRKQPRTVKPEDLIELGSYERAVSMGREFCSDCLELWNE